MLFPRHPCSGSRMQCQRLFRDSRYSSASPFDETMVPGASSSFQRAFFVFPPDFLSCFLFFSLSSFSYSDQFSASAGVSVCIQSSSPIQASKHEAFVSGITFFPWQKSAGCPWPSGIVAGCNVAVVFSRFLTQNSFPDTGRYHLSL